MIMLKGRLGLDSAKVPHKDRAGLLYLARGALTARDGTLAFLQGSASKTDALSPGDYAIPLQGVSMILLGPGSIRSVLGFPARAGIGLNLDLFHEPYFGFPRTSGDRPGQRVAFIGTSQVSPHERG